MGRRELLIALAFVAVAVVAYQLTAPASPASEGGAVGDLLAEFRREIRGNPGRGSFTHRGLIATPPGTTELRPPAVNTLTLIGEPRADIAYELTVQSVAADDTAARAAAEGAGLAQDAFGSVLALRVTHPPQARSTSTMTVRVPARLAIRLEGVRRATVSQVGALHLEGFVGDAQVSEVAGAVSGSHRNGTLTLAGAASVTLTLTGSRTTLSGIRGTTSLTGRGGEIRLADPAGAVDVNGTDLDVSIATPRSRVRIDASNGDVVIDRPAAGTEINGRRLKVTVTLATAVPVTAATTEGSLTLLLDGPPAVTIDAAASEGATIDASGFGVTAEPFDRGLRLTHRFGDDARVALRNQRGAIVIGPVK
jgi:hypothetical protein